MQPKPRRSVHVERAVDAARPRQPQRHDGRRSDGPRRLAAEARATSSASAIRSWFSSTSLSDAFTSSGDAAVRRPGRRSRTPRSSAEPMPTTTSDVLAACEPTTITHRRGQTKFLAPGRREEGGVSQDGPGGGKALPAGLRAGQGPRRGRRWPSWPWPAWPRGRRPTPGRCCCCRPTFRARRAASDLEIIASRSSSPHRYHRVSNFLASTVMREGEAVLARNVMDDSTLGTPRQPGRNPGHQRHLRPDPPRQPGVRTDPPLFHRRHRRARPGRSGVHPGRGRHGGGGGGEHPPPAGVGREPHPGAHRERRAARAAGHPQRDHRPQRGDPPGDRGDRPRRRQQLPRC